MATKVYSIASFIAVVVALTTDNWPLFATLVALGFTIVFACLYSGLNVMNLKRSAIVLGIVLAVIFVRAAVPTEEVYRTVTGHELVTRSFLTGKVIRVQKIGD